MDREKNQYTMDELFLPGEKDIENVFHSGSDHPHTWVICTHEGANFRGNQPKCNGSFAFGNGSTHQICSNCGKERYQGNWGQKVSDIFKKRALGLGLEYPPNWPTVH